MLLLAVDTATPAVAVALYDGARVLAASHQVDARRHGELLLPAIDRVLTEAGRELGEVTGLVAGTGPGPYTGLRVGLVTVQAIASARGIPAHGLCTLDGIAYATGLDRPFVVATDARRKEVYWARYEDARTRTMGPDVARPTTLTGQLAELTSVGAGAVLYADTFTGVLPELPQHASAPGLAALAAERIRARKPFPPLRPRYLRRPDATVPVNYKVVTGPEVAPHRTSEPRW